MRAWRAARWAGSAARTAAWARVSATTELASRCVTPRAVRAHPTRHDRPTLPRAAAHLDRTTGATHMKHDRATRWFAALAASLIGLSAAGCASDSTDDDPLSGPPTQS